MDAKESEMQPKAKSQLMLENAGRTVRWSGLDWLVVNQDGSIWGRYHGEQQAVDAISAEAERISSLSD